MFNQTDWPYWVLLYYLFYQMAHLICGSRFTMVKTIPVHYYVGQYFIRSSIWIIQQTKWKNCYQKDSFWFSKELSLWFRCHLEKIESVLRDKQYAHRVGMKSVFFHSLITKALLVSAGVEGHSTDEKTGFLFWFTAFLVRSLGRDTPNSSESNSSQTRQDVNTNANSQSQMSSEVYPAQEWEQNAWWHW